MPSVRCPDRPSASAGRAAGRPALTAREEQDIHLFRVERRVGRDDPLPRVTPGVADDGERRFVILAVDVHPESRELVPENSGATVKKIPVRPSHASRRGSCFHDAASSPTPAHSRKGRSLASSTRTDRGFPRRAAPPRLRIREGSRARGRARSKSLRGAPEGDAGAHQPRRHLRDRSISAAATMMSGPWGGRPARSRGVPGPTRRVDELEAAPSHPIDEAAHLTRRSLVQRSGCRPGVRVSWGRR